jgi:hypothetical protein
MVTDVAELDFDQDGDIDFLIAGEWMPLTILENTGSQFQLIKLDGTVGLWKTLEVGDFDGDGDPDVMAGNFGENNFLAKYFPGGLWLGDFDQNGVVDPIVYFTKEEKKYPLASRDLLIKQMSSFKGKQDRYIEFSKLALPQLFPNPQKDITLEIIESVWLENQNGRFVTKILPLEVQFSPVMASFFDVESNLLFLGQNFLEISPYLGRQDAGMGLILKWDASSKDFKIKQNLKSGQIRRIQKLNNKQLLLGLNNDTLTTFFIP